ncbi:Retrovirus-related Pol polyprotein from transposon 17.6 [Vitis vinifera]|uniref:Retrovirus-related Pol polyprotein from transposon 17.6 n=1 Tax=Vitis vinifera TaxID=29760 RepID=A0A438FWE2_VITVI|nr:Retrovirus-related Pol polyprotein from transposon 17.6 [Vitis vinifera]
MSRIKFPHVDFGSLVQALYGIEEGIARGLWPDSSPSDSKGKKPAIGQRPGDVSAISTYRSPVPFRPMSPTYLHSTPQPVYATQTAQRPPAHYPQPKAPPASRPMRQFSHLGMPLSRAFQKLIEGGLLTALAPRPPPQPLPPQFRMDLHCAYHQGPGHDTDRCSALRHAIQDLIDQGLVKLGQPSVTTNPLPAHTTHSMPPPTGGIHHMDFVQDDVIHMLSWDDALPEMIVPDDGYEIVGATSNSSIPAPFSLIPDRAPLQLIPFTPSYVGHRDMFAPFILWPEDVDVQVMTRSGRIAQAAPPATRPFGGTDSREEVRREDDEILRQLQSTQARISIWSLLATSSIHRDALIRALSQIRVETSTTPEGLIHMMTADRATCIVFSADDIPPEGSDHTRPLYITVVCSGHKVPSVLLDNGSALNVCPLATAIALGFAPSDFGPSTQTVRAYDSTQREVMGTLTIDLLIGPTTFSILFQVLRIPASFNLLLGRPWIHQAGAIPSSLHQKVKFIHDGQTLEIQDFCRDFVAMSFDQHSSTLVLDMMRGMSFLPSFGLERCQHGSSEFVTSIDHETPYGLGFTPSEDDVCYMARLRRDRVRARFSGIPFDYPIRSYTFSLADYFVKGSEVQPRVEEIGVDDSTLGELQHVFHQMQLDDETPDMSASVMILPPSPDRASLFSLCFPDETTDYGIAEEDQTIPAPELSAFVIPTIDMYEGTVGPIEGASDSVDPPLSFDILSGFVTRFDCVSDDSVMDLSIYEYSSVSCDDVSLFAPYSLTSQIFDINNEIAQPDSDDQPRELKIGLPLSTDERNRLIHLLRSYLDVFAWSYEDMPGLDPSIVQHHLPILPHARPVKQKLRRLHPRWSLQVKEEIQKQLSVGFISVVKYPEWLSNVVPVPKKDGKVRVCVDFRDLNKTSPKDDFPLPHIDLLVDGTAGHLMLSFMDGFSGYNQILMASEDMEKTAFITEWGTYCYRVTPFGLKNAGVTYQRAATALFHDMMHRDVEVYVDDMIVKSRGRADHLAALERFFERIRKFRLRLNPKKCTFGVTSGKLLGHMVSERGIEVDPDKIKAILDMPVPRTEKEIRGFLGRLQYISRFIARLTDICEPIFRLLRKNQPTVWNDDCQLAFERIKEYLLSPPVLVPPMPGRPLLLYLSVSDMALGCMLAQLDDSGKERAIYYLSKRMLEYEMRYVMIEHFCLALVWATRRLRHYMTEYSVHLISRLDPLRYLFDRPALAGRLMRWLVLLTEFDIHYVSQKSIKGRVVVDHLASLPIIESRPIDDDFPDEEFVTMTRLSGWRMYFDGVANHSGYGIGVLLVSPQGDHIPRSVRLTFPDYHPTTNNIVEYEACILGLETALELGITRMDVLGDSNLVLRQVQGDWKTRDAKLKPYHAYLELLIEKFEELKYIHLPRAHNQFADALATLASTVDIPTNVVVRPLLIETRSAPAYCHLIDETEVQDDLPWFHDIRQFLRFGTYPEAATAKDRRALRQLATRFVICGETLYRRSVDGILLLCLDRASADRVMREVHAGVCGPHMGGHRLARKIMRTGYFWSTMETDCCQFVQRCPECQMHGDLIHVPPSELHALTSPWPFSVWGIDIIGKISPKSSNGHEFILVSIDYFTKWVEAASYAKLTSSRVATTPYSLVYGMEAVLPIETEMGSLRVALKQQISETEWAQTRFDQLNLLDERRLRAADHVQTYQRKMARAFRKRVKPRPLHKGDLVLRMLRGLIGDPRGKFRPNWSGPYVIRELTPEGAAWLTDLDGNQFLEPTNVDQLKKYYV